jgi:predicted alpha/beta hydrolase family esterase
MQSDGQTGTQPAPILLHERSATASVLLLPGLDDSGPGHWQSQWAMLSDFRRVDFGDWTHPTPDQWVPRLDRAVRESTRPLVLAAHSLGCLTAAWWASLMWSEAFRDKLVGALLVAPADAETGVEPRLHSFAPLPLRPLPFRTIVVASRNDPYAAFAQSQAMAAAWGAELVDAGEAGHINAESDLGGWPEGLRLLAGLTGHKGNLLTAELGLRIAFA